MQQYEFIELSELKLDPKNPRLPKKLIDASDNEIVDWMLKDASLIELMLAIGENGYFAGEPLLVVKEPQGTIVVEGNRRLASLLLLNDMVISSVLIGSVAQVKTLTSNRPKKIPCIKFESRNEIEKYLGFRHVTGVKEWSPLAKARYLTSLLPTTLDEDIPKEQFRDLAKQIGSKTPYVQRLLVSYQLFELVELNSYFEIPNLNEETFHFTYLMDSLNRPDIRDFLGVNFAGPSPLGDLKLEAFKELIEWFFLKRSNGKSAMIADSASLSDFCAVLNNEEAIQYFREHSSLKKAFELTIDKDNDYRELIFLSSSNIKQALTKIVDVKKFYKSDLTDVQDIKKYSEFIIEAITTKLDQS